MWFKLIQIMADKKVKGKDLAEKTGLHVMTISSLRSGKRKPSMETLQLLADALDVDRKELL